MKTINNKDYLTIKELSEILQVSRVTVFKKVKSGEIKAEMIGKTFIIPKQQVDGIIYNTLSEKSKREIDQGVSKVMKEYGDVIKKLGEENKKYAQD